MCGFLPTAAAEVLERLRTANPKSDLSFNGSKFVVTIFSEVGLMAEPATFAVDKVGTEAFALTCSLSEVFASSSWWSDLDALGVSFSLFSCDNFQDHQYLLCFD